MLEVDNAPTSSSTPSNDDIQEAISVAAQLDASIDSGDYEIPVVKQKPSGPRPKHTVSRVKADAKKILERFLLLTEAAQSGALNSSDFDVEHQYAVVSDPRDQLPTPYQPMGSDESLYDKSWKEAGVLKSLPVDYMQPVEPDYVDCQEVLANRTKLTGTKSYHALSLFTNDPDAKKFVEHPPKVKSSTKRNVALDANSSSSSTEDYEYTDNELINRKKKNFFRWATERLQHSFRHQGKKPAVTTNAKSFSEKVDVVKGDIPLPMPPGHVTSSVSSVGLHRDGSEKSKSNSSSTPSESIDPVMQHRNVELEPLAEENLQKKGTFTWRKSDSGKDKKKDAGSGLEDKPKDGRGMFEGFLRQFKRGSAKLKGKAKHRSHSADTVTIRRPTSREMKLVQQYAAVRPPSECDSDVAVGGGGGHQSRPCTRVSSATEPRKPMLLSDLRLSGHRSNASSPRLLRSKMNLDGLVSCRPQMPPPTGFDLPAPLSGSRRNLRQISDNTDGSLMLQDLEKLLIHRSSKPFAEKSEHEKDELFERIAEQLALIADRLNLESPHSLKSSGPDDEKPAVADAAGNYNCEMTNLEILIPRPTGDACALGVSAEVVPAPVVAELVTNARDNDVRRFQQLVSDNVGSDTGWQAIARMFRLTQSAVQMAGMGTSVAIQIKEMTLNYFEDRFADWIVGQGGWESMVEETNTELDSEVD